jgi:MHS family proline/betaine transporter-like MFS transporter
MKKIKFLAVMSVLMGTILEWYDFSLIASMAPIISSLFFPAKIKSLSLLATYGVFASGFLMRPVGAVIFGHIGDKCGRNAAFSLTIMLMVIPTTMMGLLPTYYQVGVLAPALLIGLRLIQGVATSGEYSGAICYLTELAPIGRRGFWGSISMFGVAGGMLLGSIINACLLSELTSDQIYSWGWRIPFLIGLPLTIVGCFVRYKLAESKIFDEAKKKNTILQSPIMHLLRFNLLILSKVALLFSFSTVSFYISFVYIGGYLVSVNKLSLQSVMLSTVISSIIFIMLIPLFGYISDKLNRKSLMFAGAVSLFLFYYPIFKFLLLNNYQGFLIGQILIAFFLAMLVGPMAAMTAEMFCTSTRYSGVSLGLNIGASLFGGTCPLVATYLVHLTRNEAIPALYPVIFAVLSFFIIYTLKGNQHLCLNEIK